MKVREHIWVADKCVVCGAMSWAKVRAQAVLAGKGDPGVEDERQCLEREDHITDLRPEPARRQFAYQDWDTIHARVVEREKERLARAGESAAGDCC